MERNMQDKEGKTASATPATLREAAVWFELIHSDEPSTDTLAGWQRWLVEKPEHRHAFRRVEDLWRTAGGIANPPWATLADLQADDYDATLSIADWKARTKRAPHARLWSLAAGLAAVAAGATLYLAMFRNSDIGTEHVGLVQTGASEHRDMTLPDGTRVTLGARSAIRVEYTDDERGVNIERGEVFFQVA